ncbi:MAG: 23S rRNA (pseudouridine(1915)-N(3))-methyltransferase RlmH [Patescibacteria group bacterium]
MYSITLIVVGKLKEQQWKSACEEYNKRMRPFSRMEIIELKEESFAKPSEKNRVLGLEGSRIAERIPRDSFVVALDREGTQYSSERLAQAIKQVGEMGDRIVFIIGGPLGLSPAILAKASLRLSLSQLTLPHQLARVVLAEQLYRAMTILHGKQYHY